MVRCFLDPSEWSDVDLRLSPEESHHVARVLRKGVGEPLVVFDGRGRWADGQISRMEKDAVRVEISEVRNEGPSGPPRILAQALVKGDRADMIVRKAVELGLDRLAWFGAERSVVRLDAFRAKRRLARWRGLAIQAAKQCGRNRIPEMVRFESVSELCRHRDPRQAWFLCSLDAQARPAREEFRRLSSPPSSGICVAVGPEGDFTPHEERLFIEADARRISLGPHTLRTETAALFVLSALAYEWDG